MIERLDKNNERADLVEQRDFLLSSLDDLEREHEAADIDERDYEALREDYIARAAAVMHALDRPARPQRATTTRAGGRIAAWTAGVLVFAVLCGLAVAWAAGRGGSSSVAGGARDDAAQAEQLMGEGKFEDAIAAFSRALDAQPSNARALTYRGWLYAQTNQPDKAWADLDASVALDPALPDTHVFRAVLFVRDNKWDDADREYQAINVATAPAEIGQLVAQFRLRERIVAARVSDKVLAAASPAAASSAFSSDDLRVAADQLAEDGRVTDALKLLEIVLTANKSDFKALATEGWIIARSGQQLIDSGATANGQQLLTQGRSILDQSIKLDATYLPARVYRAFVALAQGESADADADLKVFETAKDKPIDLQMLVDQAGLRQAINDAMKAGK